MHLWPLFISTKSPEYKIYRCYNKMCRFILGVCFDGKTGSIDGYLSSVCLSEPRKCLQWSGWIRKKTFYEWSLLGGEANQMSQSYCFVLQFWEFLNTTLGGWTLLGSFRFTVLGSRCETSRTHETQINLRPYQASMLE